MGIFNFNSLIKMCETECEGDWARKSKHLHTVLSILFEYISNEFDKNENVEVYKDIETSINDYLKNISRNNVRNKTIEYYLCKKAFSNKSELKKKYNETISQISYSSFNPSEYDFSYSFNMDNNLEKLIMKAVLLIRDKQCDIIEENPELVDKIFSYGHISANERIKKLKREKNSKQGDLQDFDEESYKFLLKSEYEIVEDMLKDNLQDIEKYLKEDCINCIVESVSLLDKFGFMKYYTKLNENALRSFFLKDVISYDKVMETLKEENLQKLSMEKLILLSSFWSNRVNKVISSINEALYIISNDQLFKVVENDNKEQVNFGVSERDKKLVNLKFKVLHKISFDMFEEIDADRKENENERNPEKFIKKVVEKYGKQYEQYFNELFPNINNSLEDDLWFALLYENIRYNSYKVKDKSIQSLLVCLFNSNSNSIENYGYRIEHDKKGKKHVSIAVDMKGLNMPLMLHVNKQLLLDFLQESEETTLFSIYLGGEDFEYKNGEQFNAQILIPLTDEMQETIIKKVTSVKLEENKSRTLKHLVYLTENGKMPEHMMTARKSKKGIKYKFVRKYIDLAESEDDKRSQER